MKMKRMFKEIKVLSVILFCLICVYGCGAKEEEKNEKEIEKIEVETQEQSGDITDEKEREYVCEKNNLQEYEEITYVDESHAFSDGKAWIRNSSASWKCIDIEGNVLFELAEGFVPAGDFLNGICLVGTQEEVDSLANEYHYIIDEQGKFILLDCIGENDTILLMSDNNGSVDIWIKTVISSYDGVYVQLKVIDEKGNTKAVYTPNDILNDMTMQGMNQYQGQYTSNLECLGEGMYAYGNFIFNVEDEYLFMDETIGPGGSFYIKYHDSYGVDCLGNLKDKQGNILVYSEYGMYDAFRTGIFSEGLYFKGTRGYEGKEVNTPDGYLGGFYDKQGKLIIDLSKFLVCGEPYFKNEYCVLELVNEIDETFVGVIDKEGKFVLEPIQGRKISDTVQENIIAIKEGSNISLIALDGVKKELESDVMISNRDIFSFNDGWAKVQIGDYHESVFDGFIDKDGNYLKIKIPIENDY